MARLGILTLQAMDSTDVFLRADVYLDGLTDPAEFSCEVLADPGFETGAAYLTGKVPEAIPVTVEGDTALITGNFRMDAFTGNLTIGVYLEYEEQDELMEKEKKEETGDERGVCTEILI
jgi:hypothetical protein